MRFEEVLNKLKEIEKSYQTIYGPIDFCLDCMDYAKHSCYSNNHLVLYMTVDCDDVYLAIQLFEWLQKKGFIKNE